MIDEKKVKNIVDKKLKELDKSLEERIAEEIEQSIKTSIECSVDDKVEELVASKLSDIFNSSTKIHSMIEKALLTYLRKRDTISAIIDETFEESTIQDQFQTFLEKVVSEKLK